MRCTIPELHCFHIYTGPDLRNYHLSPAPHRCTPIIIVRNLTLNHVHVKRESERRQEEEARIRIRMAEAEENRRRDVRACDPSCCVRLRCSFLCSLACDRKAGNSEKGHEGS